MTFKNIPFDDSVTMRSLVKVAKEKGWLKEEEPIRKEADSKTNFSPTNNMDENIIKLCQALRLKGFNIQAEDLEKKFSLYKKAKAIKYYKVFKETGEDLIEEAHPKGSHKVSDIEGDATVETIIDQHLEIVKTVNKQPTGKVTNASILLDVSRVLSGEKKKLTKKAAPTSDQISNYNMILGQAASMLNNIAAKLESAPEDQIGWNWENPASVASNLRRWANVLTGSVKAEVANGNTNALVKALDNIKNVQRDKVQVFNKDNKDANRIAAGMIDNVVSKLEQISWSIQHPDYTPPAKEYEGSTFSKTQSGHHWEAKYVIPGVTTKVDEENYLPGTVADFKNVLNWHANQIQKNVLNEETNIYAPIPDNDTAKINIMDRAFDRAQNFKDQLFAISAALKGHVVDKKERLTKSQLNGVLSKFSMFKKQQFNSHEELSSYLSKIQKSIYDAIGIKQ